jgi:hypothetical protein
MKADILVIYVACFRDPCYLSGPQCNEVFNCGFRRITGEREAVI